MGAIFHIITFGCQMNVRDSEWLAAMLRARGMEEGCPASADLILINTCSVREKPERRLKIAIANLERERPVLPLIGVLGCVAQQLGKKLYELSPAIRLVAGGDGVASIPDALETLLENRDLRLEFLAFSKIYPERIQPVEAAPEGSAFVNIMQGCDNFCAYCIVPFTRGRQKSRQMESVLNECVARIKGGARDITLLGQNVNAYGQDIKEGHLYFPSLLRKVAELPGVERLHFVTPHPKDFDAATVSAFGELPNLCPRLHLPLQSGSDKVLRAMGRKYTRDDFLELVGNLRKTRPDIALSTDLIVGFPGEDERDFSETLILMKEAGFMSSYSFCYSDRPGTRASRMLNKIDPHVMHERLLRLQELQEELSSQWLQARTGSRTKLLMERESPRMQEGKISWQGRDPYGAIVHVELPPGEYAGKMVDVIIESAKKHSLAGRLA